MKITQIHNKYKKLGGEDLIFCCENKLLKFYKNEIFEIIIYNATIDNKFKILSAACGAAYSDANRKLIRNKISENLPDIVHIHNFFPLLTPSVYDACIDHNVPVVQTLHNYRTICPGALLMRDGQVCELCIKGSPYQAVLHRCYRNSIPGSWAVARMVAYHRKKQTWQHKVDRFIALTQFAKNKFVEAGFPAHKIAVKPNFYSGKGISNNTEPADSRFGALFVGRISQEKGIRTLVKAWKDLTTSIRVVGDGPLLEEIQSCGRKNIISLGQLSADRVSSEMTNAAFLILSSECYENFPLTIAEAFAHGLPVVASRLGAMAEIVEDGVTGLHFEPGNAEDLAAKVRWMNNHPDERRQMGYNARREFEAKYNPERNYEMLMKIYQDAIDENKQSRQH